VEVGGTLETSVLVAFVTVLVARIANVVQFVMVSGT